MYKIIKGEVRKVRKGGSGERKIFCLFVCLFFLLFFCLFFFGCCFFVVVFLATAIDLMQLTSSLNQT